MKNLRNSVIALLLTVGLAACSGSPTGPDYTPGPNNYTPGPNNYTPGPNN